MDTSQGKQGGRRGRALAGLGGVAVGAGATVAAIVALTAGAGATVEPEAVPVEEGERVEWLQPDDQAEAFFACVDGAFESVIGGVVATTGPTGLDEVEIPDGAWESLDEAAAECDALLPEDWTVVEGQLPDDVCLPGPGVFVEHGVLAEDGAGGTGVFVEHGVVGDPDGEWFPAEDLVGEDGMLAEIGDLVIVETADGSTFVELGEGDGEVTITKVDGAIEVSVDGDATAETVDWEELDWEGPDWEGLADECGTLVLEP